MSDAASNVDTGLQVARRSSGRYAGYVFFSWRLREPRRNEANEEAAKAFDPTHGLHFANQVAGGGLSLALLVTCVPTLAIAGLVGIFGARWMEGDIAAAERADRLAARG